MVSLEQLLKYKLEKLEDQRDLYWRQRAHVHWLKNGDRNTNYFHQYASERKRRNRLRKLIRDDGSVVTDEAAMKALITDYYRNLFKSCTEDRYEEMLQHVPTKVTEGMNESLMR